MIRRLSIAAVLGALLLSPAFAVAQDEGHEGLHPTAEHTGAAAHDEPHGEAHGFDVTGFAATLVNFFIWLAIVSALLRKPLLSYLKSRRLTIVEGLEQSQRLKEAAEQKYAEYSARLENLDRELAQLRAEMIQAGEAERDRIIADAEARAARMRKDAQFVIDQRMKQLKIDLTREAIEAAVAAAEAVLCEQTTSSDQRRLAEAYLKDLKGSMGNAEARA